MRIEHTKPLPRSLLSAVYNNATFALLLSGLASLGGLICTLTLLGNVYDPYPWLYYGLDILAGAGYIAAVGVSIGCWRKVRCWIRSALTIVMPLFMLILLGVAQGSVPQG